MNLLDQLLDENDDSEIRLKNEDGTELVFNQVAVIPQSDALYCILAPVSEIEGVSDDEAIVFRVDEKDGDYVLVLEEDEEVAMQVFEEYVKLWEESNADEDGEGSEDGEDD